MEFSFAHEFSIEPEGFWQLFFSEPYEKDLFRCLKMKSYTVVERRDEGRLYRRVLDLSPEMAVPSWATNVVRETRYREHDVFHRDRSAMDITIEPAVLKERFVMSGVFKVTPLPGGRCRREFSGEIRILVPLIGGKIEKFLVDRMREGYDAAAALTRDWIARGASSS